MYRLLLKSCLSLCLCLLLFACSKISQENFDRVETNMSMKQVIAILGEPTSSESISIAGISGTSAVWKDKNGEINIQFLDNKVTVKTFSKPDAQKSPSSG